MLPSRRLAPPNPRTTPAVAGIGAKLTRHPTALALAAYALFAVILFASDLRAPTAVTVGNILDTPQFLWFIRWYAFAIAHGHPLLVSDYVDYPSGINLMWNTSVPLLAVIFTPLTLVAGPAVSLNVVNVLAPTLSAWAAYLAIRRHVLRAGAAMVGGAVFGFSPFVMTQVHGHPQLAFAVCVPLVCLLLDEILVRQRRPVALMGGLLGLLAAAQVLVGEELLAITAVVAVAGAGLLIAINGQHVRSHLPYATKALLIAAATALILTAYPLGVQLFGPQRPLGVLQGPWFYQTDLLNLVVPTDVQLLPPGGAPWAATHFWGGMENGSYLGLPLVGVLYFLARRHWASGTVRWGVLLLLITTLLSMGYFLVVGGLRTTIPLPWSLLARVPPLNHILPVRMMGPGFLIAGLLLAKLLDLGLASTYRGQRRFAVGVVAVALLLLLPRPPSTQPVGAPAFFTTAAVRAVPPGSVALLAPFAQTDTGSIAMGWQAQANLRFRMPEGYAYGPHWLSPPPSRLQTAMVAIQLYGDHPPLRPGYRQQLLAELHQWTVQTVIVGPMDNQPAMVDFFSRLLGRPPVETGGVFVWWDVDQS